MSPAKTANTDFNTLLRRKAQSVNHTLQQLLAKHTEINSDLKDAMKYTLFAPGKRVASRPAIRPSMRRLPY